VRADENEAELSTRVLALEHKLYPWSLSRICSGDIRLSVGDSSGSQGTVYYSPRASNEAQECGFRLVGPSDVRY
jgi:hypothetical protein